ncbi:hypothetical protein NM688_g7949 [Phlebia brevispora]|uniref:Uncharacterized protein n=1 Tax=Phlebia brevispora TaxID=194682 RepID=A0ACC1RZC8_9APHY|nr:hypothetical protein NM688_g7949 [Phlebia brevispora]
MIQWDKDTPENAAKGLEIADKLTAHVKVAGQAYGNYSPDAGILPTVEGPAKRNRAKELFRDHYPKMQEIKRKYDPDVIFNRWFAIEPAKA